MEKGAEDEGARKIVARPGEIIKLGDGAVLQILYPERKTPPALGTNVASVVVRLTFGNESFLFTGDLPAEQEIYLAEKYGESLHANVLKFGHHGSKNSSSPEFLDAVHPEYGVVSAGAGNKYGHPNQEVLDLAEKDGIKVLRTDTEGRIVFTTDGVNLSYSVGK
jgi:competence protein ComEC